MSSQWIVFEGSDDVGKTTLARAVYDACLAAGMATILTSEPGSPHDPICKVLRSILFSGDVVESAELFLFLADRMQHEDRIVLPELAAGKVVLQDRGMLSTFAYQVILQQSGECRVMSDRNRNSNIISAAWTGRRLPDLIVLCDADDDRLDRRRQLDADHFIQSRGIATTKLYRDIRVGAEEYPKDLVGLQRMYVTLNTAVDLERETQRVLDSII